MLPLHRAVCLALLPWATGCAFAIPLGSPWTPDTGSARVVVVPDIVRDADTGPDDTPLPPCEWVGVPSLPAPDATDAYYRDPIRFRLSVEDPTASIALRSPDGDVVGGRVAPRIDDPTVVELWPDAPLEPGATYRATATYCDGRSSEAWAFTVSAAGRPLDCALPGGAWQVDLEHARWNAPAGLGGLVPHLVETDLYVGITGEEGLRVEALAAAGLDDQQDTCVPTTALPPTERSGPDLTLPESTVTLELSGATASITHWRMDATALPDCSGWEGGRTRGEVDLRELTEVIRFDGASIGAAGLCAFFSTYDTDCIPCADGEVTCLAFDVEGIRATALPSALTCVDAADCHPTCGASVCEDPTAGECG